MKLKLSLLSHNVIVLVEHYGKFTRIYYSDGHNEISSDDLKKYVQKNKGLPGYKNPILIQNCLLYPTSNQKSQDCQWINLDYLEQQDNFYIDFKFNKMLTFSTFLHIIIMNLYVGVMYMKELNYKKIGERLRKLRKYMGLTQEQVAEILSVGRDAILRIEKGDRKIDLQELISFSKLYNISMDELTTEEHTINSSDVAFARGFNELSEKDKKEIISLIEYKNILKSQNKDD